MSPSWRKTRKPKPKPAAPDLGEGLGPRDLSDTSARGPQPPAQIRVGPYIYRVEVSSEWYNTNDGRTDSEICKLWVNANLAPCMQRETLWHEVMHAAWNYAQLGTDDRGEEDVIKFLSPVLVQILLDNPALVIYLTAK